VSERLVLVPREWMDVMVFSADGVSRRLAVTVWSGSGRIWNVGYGGVGFRKWFRRH
jgi:hypothetical protein